jgi:hypothetical protein
MLELDTGLPSQKMASPKDEMNVQDSPTTVCLNDLGKLNLLLISQPWYKSMKQTVKR